jgi:drug/metabolite transporter (DMT)-like permease
VLGAAGIEANLEAAEAGLKQRPGLAPNAAILCSALLWGTLWIPLRGLSEAGASAASATVLGFLLPLVVLLPRALRDRRRILAGGWDLGIAGLCLAAAIALYSEGLVRGQVARVILLFYLTPVWSTLLGRLLLGQPITDRRIATIALGLAGLVVVLGFEAGIPYPRAAADWMGLAGGVVWAFAMLYLGRTASHPPFDRVFVQFLFLGPVFWLLSQLPGGAGRVAPEAEAFLRCMPWLLAFAGIWMLPVVWLTIFGASWLDPVRVAIFLMLEIVVGISTAALLAGEPFGPRELAGAVLILGASGVEITAKRRADS